MVSHPADALGHGAHGAEGAPGSRTVQAHDDQANQKRGQHQAVKAEAELSCPVGYRSRGIGPAPGNTDGPEQPERLPQALSAACHQPGLENHIGEHCQEKEQKAVSEPPGEQESRRPLIEGAPASASKEGEKLPPTAQMIAEKFISPENCQKNRQKKIDHPKPGK